MVWKYIKRSSLDFFIKRRETKKISTTSVYVSTKICPVWQTVQGLWYSIIKCQWDQTAIWCLYSNIQNINMHGKFSIFGENIYLHRNANEIISVTNKLIMQLNSLRYSGGRCRISQKLPASIFREVTESKFLQKDGICLFNCKAPH
jgi:hypothetical protein